MPNGPNEETPDRGESAGVSEHNLSSNDPKIIDDQQQETNRDISPVEFLRRFVGDPASCPWAVTAINADRKVETRTFDKAQTASDWIELKVRQGFNIYFNPATPSGRLTSKAKKTDIAGSQWLWADADPEKLKPQQVAELGEAGCRAHNEREREAIRAAIEALQLAPTIIVDSGNGFQCFWKLAEPLTDHEAVEARNRWLVAQIGNSADHCWNIDRVMRLPGTPNVPSPLKIKAGITWTSTASIATANWDKVYAAREFGEAPVGPVAAAAGEPVTDFENLPTIAALEDVPALRGAQCDSLRHLIAHGHRPDFKPAYASRSEALLAAVRGMLLAGVDHPTIVAIQLDARFAISESVREKRKGAKSYAERQLQSAIAKNDKPKPAAERPVDADANAKVLATLNEKHFISQEGGQWRVYNEDFDPDRKRKVLTRSSTEDFGTAYRNKTVLVDNGEGKIEVKKQGAWWLDNPRRREYNRIVFMPGREAPPDSYNLWRGFAVEPKKGDWGLLRQHIREIVCGNDETSDNYLGGWMARRVQNLDDRGWSAVIFKGEEGVGKGIVANQFGKLFGQHFLHVSHSKHLVGNFNMHLRDCLVLFADEAFWAGDKQGESTLKMLVTEEDMPIEGKGRDVVMGRNRVALMMASNHEWMVPAGLQARRFFALLVANSKKDDREYFNAILAQMDNGGREAMLYDLLHHSLVGYEVRDVPRTAELYEQKVRSMTTEQAWWHGKLVDGKLLKHHDQWEQLLVCEDMHADYIKVTGKTGTTKKANEVLLALFLKKVLPKGHVLKAKRETVPRPYQEHPAAPPTTRMERVRCWRLPPLADCREAFDKLIGQPGEWEADDEVPADDTAGWQY